MPYLNVDEVEAAIGLAAASNPGVAELVQLPHPTWEGRSCRAIRLHQGASGHILVLPETGAEDAAWENARIRAELLRTQLLEGADFAELAKQHSRDASARDGGDLGTLKRGELAQDIETQILALTAGQISSPYRSALGYHIFRLESKETLEGDGLARVRAQIREILFREKFDTRLDAWLREIKQRAVIDVRLDGQL